MSDHTSELKSQIIDSKMSDSTTLHDPVDHAFAGIDQVVDDDNVVAGVDQFHRCVAADEAGAACD